MIRRLVVFGAGGDLTSRLLLPSLARLHEAGALPEGFRLVASGREHLSTEAFRDRLSSKLEDHAGSVAVSSRKALLAALKYRRADATHPRDVAGVVKASGEPVVAYLALPPSVYPKAVEALAAAGLPEGSRIAVEKPFGHDLASARALNASLHRHFGEEAVFRVDHFLHKQTAQNVLGLRFANQVFEPIWNARHVDRVEIVFEETLGLEGRAGYYDATGALSDMIQNHLLQLLALIGMEPPATFDERDLRDRKYEVLRAVGGLTPEEVEKGTVRARYTAGRVGGRPVPAYAHEEGVEPERGTETFAQVKLTVENWRWAGVPFLLRTGKALWQDRRFLAVHFKPVPHLAFGQSEHPVPNVLRLDLGPDRVSLGVNVNGEGDPFDLERAELDADLAPQELPAYARLLVDILEGDATLSIRNDEAEESWRIVEPILEGWRAERSPLLEYAAGSQGPSRP